MILAFDTYYVEDRAKTVCAAFEHWADTRISGSYTETLQGVAGYQSGEFYKRELPCILSLLKTIPVTNVEAILVDGFVLLDDAGKWGLGGYLYDALGQATPVVGAAKANFATLNQSKREVLRGNSKRPLYITALGMDLDTAAARIKSMHGSHRLPTLLKELDLLTRA